MSHNSPVTPPPAPPQTIQRNAQQLQATPTTKGQLISQCLWAAHIPALQKACYLARVCELAPPRKCAYYDVASILQEGPTCGLTALSMLFEGMPATAELLAHAKCKQYSNNGELFSANNLYHLIDDMKCESSRAKALNTHAHGYHQLLSCELYKGELNCERVQQLLVNGACLLVPYDPDVNHAPCLRKGHKAHWALIIGYLISDTGEFYVISRHGKAKNLGVWSLNALSESNANLVEFAQPKGYPDCDFVVPVGGIGGPLGLKERAIIVNVSNHERINVL